MLQSSQVGRRTSEMSAWLHQKSIAPLLSMPASVQAFPAQADGHALRGRRLENTCTGPGSPCQTSRLTVIGHRA